MCRLLPWRTQSDNTKVAYTLRFGEGLSQAQEEQPHERKKAEIDGWILGVV